MSFWFQAGLLPSVGMAVITIVLSADVGAEEPEQTSAAIRVAVQKSLPLLQQTAKSFRERSDGRCISCHHQGLLPQTTALARQYGLAIDENLAREEIDRILGFYQRRQSRYLAATNNAVAQEQADRFGNFTVHAGYWLWALAAENVPFDPALIAAARYLATKQNEDGHWSFTDTARAPMQASDFTITALAARALKDVDASANDLDIQRRLDAARRWLLASAPRTNDDKVFRLLGLDWLAAPKTEIFQATQSLLVDQRADGGWAQQANMPTDAYATALSLVALAQTRAGPEATPAYRRGVSYLLTRQLPDGSWFVRTRAIPTNPYFESGFPHGKSQFISYAATCLATQALLQGLP